MERLDVTRLTTSALLLAGAMLAGRSLTGQDTARTAGSRVPSAFLPLELPPPNAFRTAAGTPGPMYWQQRVDYSIRASLDTATHVVRGEEIIRYTNNSPDTLRYLWMQLDQNVNAPDNPLRSLSTPYEPQSGPGGYTLERVRVRDRSPRGPFAFTPLVYRITGTVMQVMLARPLAPGQVAELDIAWHFQIPVYWRTGRLRVATGWLYQVGQWFPRLAVYDDVRGWTTDPYTGYSEFYLEYGDIDYAITAPGGYTVTGSGLIQNAAEVLTAEQRRRLALAVRSDTTISIISPQEVGADEIVPRSTGATRTWRFRAERVRDVAWAAAPNFIWDATGWNGVLVQALYTADELPVWRQAAQETRFAIRAYAERLGSYPYPAAINVHGGVPGMEYPMIVFCRGRRSVRDLFICTHHEMAHQWLPMLVGSNERLYGWQDEGITHLVGSQVMAERFTGDSTEVVRFAPDSLNVWLSRWGGRQLPAMTPLDHDPVGLFFMHYTKVPLVLQWLRREVVDSQVFDAALREYVRRWLFRHPTPADFFRTIHDVVGEDLSWFWRAWFFTSEQLDLAVDSVLQRDSAGVTVSDIYLSHRTAIVAPVDLLLVSADGSRRQIALPARVWYRGTPYVHVVLTPSAARPIRVEIDPRRVSPDANRANNRYPP